MRGAAFHPRQPHELPAVNSRTPKRAASICEFMMTFSASPSTTVRFAKAPKVRYSELTAFHLSQPVTL